MSFNLIIVKMPPYQGRSSHEVLEAIMSLGLFEISHRVVFFDQGISWLLKDQKPTQQKSLEKQIGALPMYGSEHLYYVSEHAHQLFMDQALNSNAIELSMQELISMIDNANHVEVF